MGGGVGPPFLVRTPLLVLKEVSELWRIPTLADKCISGDFFPEEFARSFQMLKPGKVSGEDFICPELIILAGAALKSWLNNFFFSCMHQLKLPNLEDALACSNHMSCIGNKVR